MVNKKIFILAEFIDGDEINFLYLTLLVTTIFFIYINQFFIQIVDIIILLIILILIFKFLK